VYYRNNRNIANMQQYSRQAAAADYGPNPFVVNIDKATAHNDTYRTALWTGKHLQLTVMSINAGDDIGLEVHPDTDQFLCIIEGSGLVRMGDTQNHLYYNQPAYEGCGVFVPAGTWHDITNMGNRPLKLFTVYAPPEHARGTVHWTKKDAEEEEAK
jgi:mannose-6-phosphate isomerase-like protein (cupin superfamily)